MLVKRIGMVVVAVLMATLGGCILPIESYTQPIAEGDILPNGTAGEVRANPKRNATPVELEAIQSAVRTNPLLSNDQVVSNVRVEAVSKPVVGFCGRLEEGTAELADATPVVTGALRTVEGQLLAYDLRYGEQAQLRCNYMQFWPDSEE
ncbi:hypothetical protein [Pusillimonas maritima]|uniref:hypothetical protein n=1 Tax=Neopusillimonas maritima TaxID=2026239 RepID=UPI00131473C2